MLVFRCPCVIYVSPQIVTGPVLELGRPVLELGRSSPHTGTVPRRGAPYWNWIQDRGFVPKRGVQCWNWASSAGTGRLSCNPDLSPAPYWHWCQYGAPHFGRRIWVGGVWQFFLASEKWRGTIAWAPRCYPACFALIGNYLHSELLTYEQTSLTKLACIK
jgi:hypothetical protein